MGKRLFVLLLAVCFIGNAQFVFGQKYPVRPVELVCPYTPGSPMDILARLIGDSAPRYLGQPLVVVNKPGAGGSTAAASLVSSPPDGYKLVTLTNMYFATTVKTQRLPFDPSQLVPIVNFVEYKLGMMVKGNSQWKILGDLLKYGKENPGKLRWGHAGRGTTMHMGPLLVFRKAGLQTIDVPYKGTPEVVSAVLGGHVDAGSMVYGGVRDHVRSGEIRYLIFFSDRRYSDPADVPSALELGFSDASKTVNIVGLFAHRNTPEDVRRILMDAFEKTFKDPEFKKGLEAFGEEPRFGGPDFIRDMIRKSEDVGVPLIKELGLFVEK